MPKTKNALTRFLAIDQCLHDQSRHYGLRELRDACNEALSLKDSEGITMRTIQNDIMFMRSDNGYAADIEEYWIDRRKYFRYRDPHFTITSLPINREEYGILQQLLGVVARFEGNVTGWLGDLEMHLNDALHADHRHPIVAFEENPDLRNSQLLRKLFNCVSEKKVIELRYHPFGKEEETYKVSTCFLKQYNRRWFVLGIIETGQLYTFSIDRIVGITEVPNEEYVEADVDFNDYFYDIIGVTRYADRPVEEIVIAVKDTRFPYIDTNPLHPSQKILHNYHLPEAIADFVAISIKVAVNHELVNTLLSFGCDVVVLSPLSLQEVMKKNLNANLQNYFHL